MDAMWGELSNIKDLASKTILTAEYMRAPFGSTSNFFLLLTFIDGTRTALADGQLVNTTIWKARDISLDEAKKHPTYFTPDDLAEIVRAQEQQQRQHERERRQREEADYERLGKRLGKI